jgi:phenol hydroxylase P0 protein
MDAPAKPPDELICDTRLKYVRILSERDNGLVVFEFAIGWPDLSVELAMPRPAFEEFCAAHEVQLLAR